MAPSIISVKRKVERERLKDGLRSWIARRAEVVQKKGAQEREKPSVRNLVQRFARRAGGVKEGKDGRWEKAAGEKRKRGEPTRAHVLGLRRFWEGIGREGQAA